MTPPNIGIFCCCSENPCPNNDPPLEVTIAWTSDPNTWGGWENSEAGKLDLFGFTWESGDTNLVCPTQYVNEASGYGHSGRAVWNRAPGGGDWGNFEFYALHCVAPVCSPAQGFAGELIEDIGANDNAELRANGFWSPFATPLSSAFSDTSINGSWAAGGFSGLTHNDFKPIDFTQLEGQITTDSVTITWAKSSYFS